MLGNSRLANHEWTNIREFKVRVKSCPPAISVISVSSYERTFHLVRFDSVSPDSSDPAISGRSSCNRDPLRMSRALCIPMTSNACSARRCCSWSLRTRVTSIDARRRSSLSPAQLTRGAKRPKAEHARGQPRPAAKRTP